MRISIGKRILAENYAEAKSIFQKGFGLMFHCKVSKPLVFFFNKEKIVPLHMWFVFMPIDVIFLDKNKKVVELLEDFKPFSFYKPNKLAKYLIEFESGTIKGKKVKIGEKVSF
jgi:uncharacterized membrane protein (UPF0127 family)